MCRDLLKSNMKCKKQSDCKGADKFGFACYVSEFVHE